MDRLTAHNIIKELSEFDTCQLANNLSHKLGDDIEFLEEDHLAAEQYLESKLTEEKLNDKLFAQHLIVLIGRIIVSDRLKSVISEVSDELERLAKTEVFLDLDERNYECILYPTYDGFCDLVADK